MDVESSWCSQSLEQLVEVSFEPMTLSMTNELWELFESIRAKPEMIVALPWIEKDITSPLAVRGFIQTAIRDRISEKKTRLAITHDGKIAGIIDYSKSSENPEETTLGYLLGANFVGKKIAKSALIKLSKDLASQGKRPVVHILPSNQKSIYLVQSAGYVKTNRVKYKGMDTYTFRVT